MNPKVRNYRRLLERNTGLTMVTSLRVTVNAVYRVKDKLGREFYYWAGFKQCDNKFNQPVSPFSFETWNYHRSPIIGLQWNEQKGISEPKVIGYQSAYESPWNPDEVRKLLDQSFVRCEAFYVGHAGEKEPIRDRYYQIFNMSDFLNGSWNDLYDLGRLGISYEHESLNLVQAARVQERQNREKAVGMKDPKVYG